MSDSRLLLTLLAGKLAGNWQDVKPYGRGGVIQQDRVTGTYKSFLAGHHPIISKDLSAFKRLRSS